MYNSSAMAKTHRLLKKVLDGSKNISFSDFILLVKGFGFHISRVSGSHHIFIHPDVKELVNLQDVRGQVKPYQIKQFMALVERYDLELKE
jgi:predicted RNA binding protein YcfA (HicA-like mRNA interferase family)